MAETLTAPAPDPTTLPEDLRPEDGLTAEEEFSGQMPTLQVVDVSGGVASEAADYGDEFLRKQTTEPGFRGFLKKIWHGNIARDYIRQREVRKSRQSDIDTGIIGSLSGVTREEQDQADVAVVERYTSEYGALLHQGETNQELSQSGAEGADELESQLHGVIRSYARGEIDETALREERTRILHDFGSRQQRRDRNKGLIYADNIIEVAISARGAFRHAVGLDALDTFDAKLDASLKVKLGEARIGRRTQASREITDKVVDKLYGTRVGSVFNETTLATAAAVGMGVSKFTVRKLVTAVGATVGLGFGTGLVAGAREFAVHSKQERRLHARQMAAGGEIDQGSRRRERMEETRYATVTAESLRNQLEASLQEYETDQSLGSLTRMLRDVTDAQTRSVMSDDLNTDLMTFDSETSVERQRTDLDMLMARVKAILQRFIDSSDDETLRSFGVERGSVEDIIRSRSELLRSQITEDMVQKDKSFNRLRLQRAASAAAVGATVGLVLGSASQEIHAALDSHLQGVFEHAAPGQDRRTELAAMFQHSQVGHQLHDFANSSYHSGSNALDLPQGYHVVGGEAGVPELVGPNNEVLGSVSFDGNGHLSAVSQHMLEQSGMKLHSTVEAFTTTHTEATTVSPTDYVAAHSDQFTQVHRDLWYDNNTPYSDYNELKGYWGSGGSGIDAQGNFTFDVSHMTPGGSFEGDQSANAQSLMQQGHLAIAISMDKASQHFVKLFAVPPGGETTFNINDPVVQAAFSNVNGHAQLQAAYLEVVELRGPSPQGGEIIRPLATLVGENHPGTLTNTTVVQQAGEHVITHIEAPAATPIEVTPVIPLRSRRGMEDLASDIQPRNPNLMPMYYGGRSLEELQEWIALDPSRLHTRRLITAPDGSRQWVEADGSAVVRDVGRERSILTEYLQKQERESPTHYQMAERVASAMTPMEADCRVSVNVPAWMEATNLRRFLEQYTRQMDESGSDLDPELYEINILVNRQTGAEADGSVQVIEQFINDFQASHGGRRPKVNFYDIELDPPYNNVGYARKLLTDAIVMRSLRRTNQTRPLYIETEDADHLRVDPHTVINVIDKLDDNQHLDAVRGVQDRAPEYLQRNDLLFITRRAHDFFELLARNKKFRDPTNPSWHYTWNRVVTGGWNTAFTAEAYGLIDGYESANQGEDMLIGEKITMVRGDGRLPNIDVVGKVYSRIDSSPRRFISELITGQEAYAGNNFVDPETNQTIRDKSLDELLGMVSKYQKINPSNEEAFNRTMRNVAGMLYAVSPTAADAEYLIKRLMFWIGFKKDDYELVEGQLNVNSWANVERALEKYRVRYGGAPTTVPGS